MKQKALKTTSHLNFYTPIINDEFQVNTLNLMAERILFLAHLSLEKNLLEKNKVKKTGEIYLDDYKLFFQVKEKSNIIPLIKKSILELGELKIRVKTEKSNLGYSDFDVLDSIKYQWNNYFCI